MSERGPKLGAGHAKAMARLGIHEVGGAFFNGSNVVQPTEMGVFGSVTPQEVLEQRRETVEPPPQTTGVLGPARARAHENSASADKTKGKEVEL